MFTPAASATWPLRNPLSDNAVDCRDAEDARQPGLKGIEDVDMVLRKVDPQAAEDAKRAYLCFEPYAREPQDYARATALVPGRRCG